MSASHSQMLLCCEKIQDAEDGSRGSESTTKKPAEGPANRSWFCANAGIRHQTRHSQTYRTDPGVNPIETQRHARENNSWGANLYSENLPELK